MPGENYNEYKEDISSSMKVEIDTAIHDAQLDLNSLKSNILNGDKKVEFKTPNSINNFYRIEGGKIIFNLSEIKNYLQTIQKRLQGMKNQKFSEISKENSFKGTILAIQIILKALGTNPSNPKKYNIPKFNGKYDEATKEAIKQFQTDKNMSQIDGKPGKNTIGAIIKSLENFIDNKKEYNKIKNIVKKHINGKLGILNPDGKAEEITNYIIKGNLGTNKNVNLENLINDLVDKIKNPLSDNDLRELVEKYKFNGKLNILNEKNPFFGKNTKYDKFIIKYSKEYSDNYKIDPALIKLMMFKESTFNPNARSGKAIGLMQLTPDTAKDLGVKAHIPEQNIKGGIKYLSQLINQFDGNFSLALAAYNAGPGKVQKYGNRIPPFKETKDYVKFITNEYNKLKA